MSDATDLRVVEYVIEGMITSCTLRAIARSLILREKRRTIPEGNTVIKENGIMELVKKRNRGDERLISNDRRKSELLKEKQVKIAELEKKQRNNEEATVLLAKAEIVETKKMAKDKLLRK
jgi:hypothetical protein